ncbi:hypothetical protein QQF64_026103 [Cirrhinus molitorella]|uniref:Uncharacterized protein n=1 Tax=Cirrhinus molitorella TaxID=172907 RepID=A0ABR3NSB2_9TELE
MVISTQEPLKPIHPAEHIQKWGKQTLQSSDEHSPDDLLLMFEDIEKMNDGRHLDWGFNGETGHRKTGCEVESGCCGSERTLKSSISEQILQQTGQKIRRGASWSSDQSGGASSSDWSLRGGSDASDSPCVSLCHPGVHVFLIIIPDAPLKK